MSKIRTIGIGAALYILLGIWIPKLRCKWKGSDVRTGPLSCAAFALMIGSICFFPFAGKTRPAFLSVLPVVSFIVGWIAAVLGQAMDARTYRRLTGLQLTPKQARGENIQTTIFLGFGLLFLTLVLYLVAHQK